MMTPVRYGQNLFRAGGTAGSVFSLIAATLGSGTLAFAYAVMMNGYVLGPLLIIFGALVSYYTGMLIVKCSVKTGRTRYEDIALAIYGPRWAFWTSVLNLGCLMGFTFSYIVYVKKAIPSIIQMYVDEDKIPVILRNEQWGGNIFWGIIFSFGIMFPMSIPRSASALRFTSLFGVLCSMYLCLGVTGLFFSSKDIVADPSKNLGELEAFKVSYKGIVSTVPLIIFAYMYQVNIPMIYVELEERTAPQMGKIIAAGSSVAVAFYCLVGVFGYAVFAGDPGALCSKNILTADSSLFKSNPVIQVGNFALLFSVIAAAPLCVLPSKDTVEELFYKEKGMTSKQNFFVTLALTTVNCVMALFIPSIGEAMTLVGSTINPIIGFILPVVFYWDQIKEKSIFSIEKMTGIANCAVIIVVSVLSLVKFFTDLIEDNADESCLA